MWHRKFRVAPQVPTFESPIMTEPPTFLEGVTQAFRDHGLTAAITALMGGSLAIAATVTRKALSYSFPRLC